MGTHSLQGFRNLSPEMLKMILAKGADPCATIGTTSALVCAAGRSTSTFGAVQALISAASDTAFGEIELRRTLNATVSLFAEGDDEVSSNLKCPGDRKSLFPMYDKIEEIFASGPGAVIEYMLHRLPQETAKGDGYSLCLQMAAAVGNYEIVRLLLEHGVDCDAVVGYYGTALIAACRFGHLATVTLLLDSGAGHTISDGEAPYTALQAAVMARSLSCVQSLLDHGANVNATISTRERLRFGSSDKTALKLAVDARLTSISVLLVEAGAHVNEDGDPEQPILIKACSWGETSVVQSLLEAGADVKVLATRDSSTSGGPQQYASALHAVIEFGHVHLIELLVAHGLDVTADCGIAGSPLEYAASKADISVVATLLALIPRHCGRSFIKAAQSAISHSRQDVVRLICEHARGILIAGDVLLLCKTPRSSVQCSIVWYLLDRLRQLNGSAGNSPKQYDMSFKTRNRPRPHNYSSRQRSSYLRERYGMSSTRLVCGPVVSLSFCSSRYFKGAMILTWNAKSLRLTLLRCGQNTLARCYPMCHVPMPCLKRLAQKDTSELFASVWLKGSLAMTLTECSGRCCIWLQHTSA